MGFDVNIFERVKRLMIDRILGSLSEICSGSLERFSVCQFPFVWLRDSLLLRSRFLISLVKVLIGIPLLNV